MSSNSGAGTAVGVVASMGIAYWIAYIMLYAIIGSAIAVGVVALLIGVAVFIILRGVYITLVNGDVRALFALTLPPLLAAAAYLIVTKSILADDIMRLSEPLTREISFSAQWMEAAFGIAVFSTGLLWVICIVSSLYLSCQFALEEYEYDELGKVALTCVTWVYVGSFTGWLVAMSLHYD